MTQLHQLVNMRKIRLSNIAKNKRKFGEIFGNHTDPTLDSKRKKLKNSNAKVRYETELVYIHCSNTVKYIVMQV